MTAPDLRDHLARARGERIRKGWRGPREQIGSQSPERAHGLRIGASLPMADATAPGPADDDHDDEEDAAP